MAVEAKRIKGRLRVLFPKANLSKKRLDEISARLAKKPDDDADESVIDKIITNANDVMPFEDIAKEDDRVRALEAKVSKKQDSDEEADEKPETKDDGKTSEKEKPTNDDVPKWAQSMLDSNAALKKELEDLKTGRITDNKKDTARKLFEKNDTFKSLGEKNKEFFFKQIDVNSETSVEDQLEELETQYNDLVQQQADSRDYSSTPPTGSGNTDKPTDDELEAVTRNL